MLTALEMVNVVNGAAVAKWWHETSRLTQANVRLRPQRNLNTIMLLTAATQTLLLRQLTGTG